MLGVNERRDFRRASLVSEIYSEKSQPVATNPAATNNGASVVKPGGPGAGLVGAGGNVPGGKPPTVIPKPPVPYVPGLRRVPKGKFGLIGLGKEF